MTLVLPYCNNQVKNLSFEPLESRIMPCVFDGEPLDFESALMGSEWPTLKDIAAEDDFGPSAANDDTKTTSNQTEKVCCKRKSDSTSETEEDGPTQSKRSCVEDDESESTGEETDFQQEPASCDSPLPRTISQQDESVGTDEVDDDLYLLPRRRVPQMWNSRQKWKDERKKVLKMSVGKLTEIEDPELWLLRSVLINNTIKRLHQDIRNERQAKIKHRQQKIDFYNNEKYEPISGLHLHHRLHQESSFDDSPGRPPSEERLHDMQKQSPTKQPSDAYDDTSCDEIFGISEDFLRVTIPDRRVSSPIPMNSAVQDSSTTEATTAKEEDCTKNNSVETAMEVDAMPSSPAAYSQQERRTDFVASRAPAEEQQNNASLQRTTTTPEQNHSHQQSQETSSTASNSNIMSAPVHHRHLSDGSQCATQYRTNTNADTGSSMAAAVADSAFPPRVPILDSVVYHSLLASLESS